MVVLSAGMLMSTSQVSAVDLFAQSGIPTVEFDDLDTNKIVGLVRMDNETSNYDAFWVWSNHYQKRIIDIKFSPDSGNSIVVASNGNMEFADSTLRIDRENTKVGIGKIPELADFDVFGDISAGGERRNQLGDGLTNLLTLHVMNTATGLTSDVGFALRNDRAFKQWNFRTYDDGEAFAATKQGTRGAEFIVSNETRDYRNTKLYLGNGAKNIGGVWINASSRALKENIKDLSTQDALAAFHKLQPVTYNYKTDKKEQVVGFIAEDVPELVAIQSRDGLSAMDMVAVLTKVMQEKRKMVAEAKVQLKKVQEKIDKLEAMQKRLAKVESLLTNLALNTDEKKKKKVSLKSK